MKPMILSGSLIRKQILIVNNNKTKAREYIPHKNLLKGKHAILGYDTQYGEDYTKLEETSWDYLRLASYLGFIKNNPKLLTILSLNRK